MNKWTWLVLLAVVILASGYYLNSRRGVKDVGGTSSGSALNVEDFDSEEGGDLDKEGQDNDGNNGFDGAPGLPNHDDAAAGARRDGTSPADVEPIDDQDDPGETVRDPMVLEDKGENVEAPPRRQTP